MADNNLPQDSKRLDMANKYTSYQDLLDFVVQKADSFSLVWQNLAFEPSAFELLEKLSPWLISDYSSSSWPRTQLVGKKARVKTYQLNKQTLEILKSFNSVFDFIAPHYPEDIAFYQGKTVVFSSIAHENQAWFE